MNEIDDEYKTKEETLDQETEEELTEGNNKETTIKHYLQTLHKQRTQREKTYKLYLEQQKKAIWKKKKKKEKKEPYKHLHVQHFNFAFSTWENIKHYLDVTYFNTKRNMTTKFWKYTPTFVLYHYYKATKEAKRLWDITTEAYNDTKKKTIEWTINTATHTWETIVTITKKTWATIKKAFSRLRGTKKEEGEEEKNDEKGEEKKEGEEPPTEEKKE